MFCIKLLCLQREVAENVMNETYARSLCEEAFLSCPVSNIIGKPVQEDTYLDDCAKDVAVSLGNLNTKQIRTE